MVNNIIWGIVLFTGVTILSPPTIIILVLGMLPTGVTYLCDKSEQKHAVLCVGGLNICGVFPYLLDIWFDSGSINDAIQIITDLFSIMIMYLAASIGWLLFRYVPPIITTFLNLLADRRLTKLKKHQDVLTEEWGILGESKMVTPLNENAEPENTKEEALSPSPD